MFHATRPDQTRSTSFFVKELFYGLCGIALALGLYVGSYYLLPGPDSQNPFTSIHHPTLLSISYYRLFYPLRRIAHSYDKTYSGTVTTIDVAKREFVVMTTPTGGIYVRARAGDDATFYSLKSGNSVRVLVECLPDPDCNACHNELLTLSRIR